MRIGSVLFSSIVVLLLAGRAVNAQPTIAGGAPLGDGTHGSLVIGGPGGQQLGQVFTAGMSKLMTQVRLPVSCAAGSDLIVEIQGTRTGVPDGIVLSSLTVPGSALPPLNGPELRILRLAKPVQLGETREFAITLQSAGTCSVLRGPPGTMSFEDELYVSTRANPNQWTCMSCELPLEEQFDLPFLAVVEDLSLPFEFRGVTATVPKQWNALATFGQVVGAAPRFGGRTDRVAATLWFNEFADVATLQFSVQGGAFAQRITLSCAPAGADGAAVWSAQNVNLSGTTVEITARNLVTTANAGTCPVAITNVAALRAAADARSLYIEIDRGDLPKVRGQLWPRSIVSPGISITSGASVQQTVSTTPFGSPWTRATTSLFFAASEQLDAVGYDVPERHRYRSVTLHCAPPGQNGEIVALLPAKQGVISQEDFFPIAATGACGFAITTTAALLEALLRGSLYVSIELIEPAGIELRGQFPVP